MKQLMARGSIAIVLALSGLVYAGVSKQHTPHLPNPHRAQEVPPNTPVPTKKRIVESRAADSFFSYTHRNEWLEPTAFGPERFKQGVTVTTSPMLGLKSAFNSSDLLYQYPSMNEDLILLQQRKSLQEALLTVGDTLNNRAIVLISGGVESQLISNRDFTGTTQADINLSVAELDIAAMISKWANAFMALDYDNSTPATGSRVTNSRIYLSRGFATFGNLSVIPVYFTLGQMYAPFGKYASIMLTAPLTLSLGRTEIRSALIGYYKNGLYAEIYGYRGNRTTGVDNLFREGGANIGYNTLNFKNGQIDIGIGAITNMADSQGMQNNGLSPNLTIITLNNGTVLSVPTQFAGFGNTPNGNALAHNVIGADVHFEGSYKNLSLIAEFIGATQNFSPADMTFNGGTARPQAMHVEAEYSLTILDRALTFGLVFGKTWQAFALNLPEQSYAFIISTALWKNTMLGIEYRHDINYPSGTTATGTTAGTTLTNQAATLPVPIANGRQRNMITLQLGAYF